MSCLLCNLLKTVSRLDISCLTCSTSSTLNIKAQSSLARACARRPTLPDRATGRFSPASIKGLICPSTALSTRRSTARSPRPAARITPSRTPTTVPFTKATTNLSPSSKVLLLASLTPGQVPHGQLSSMQIPDTGACTLTQAPQSPTSRLFKHLPLISSTREPANHNLRATLSATRPAVAPRKLISKCEDENFFFSRVRVGSCCLNSC